MNNKKKKDRRFRKLAQAAYKEEKRQEYLRTRYPLSMSNAKPEVCGECQACCEVIGVTDIPGHGEKSNYTRCVHQCESGCSIYQDRPDECRRYYCLWQQGILTGGLDFRPDKLGILIDFREGADYNDKPNGTAVIVLWEVRPGAMQQPKVRELVRRLKEQNISRKLKGLPFLIIKWNEYGLKKEATRYPLDI